MSKRSSLSATSFFSPSPIARRLTPDIDAFPATPSRSPSGRLRSTSSQVAGVLDLLKTIFEGVDSFPCIKYVAGVGVKILEVIEEVQANNERLRDLAMRAGEVVVAVSRSCQGLKSNTEAELERDLTQLTSVMTAILAFTTENASKGRITQIIQRSEFASALDMLDKQLMHAFQIFQIQSSISLRMSSSKIIDAVTSTSKDVVNKQIFPVPSEPIDIDEGFYMLCNVSDGRVVEIENQHGPSHVFLSPSRDGRALSQVWAISKIPSTEAQYTIRNVAVGNTLDLNHFEERSGSYVIAWPGSKIIPDLNHTWTFHRVKGAEGVDYCVIRTCQGSARSFFDGVCPVSKKCDYLHCTHLSSGSAQMSQLWILISFPPSAAVPSEPAALVPKQRIHRPRFLLQNVSTAAYATVIQVDQDEDVASNVIFTSDPTKATRWSFMLGFDGYPTLNNSGSLVAHLPESPSSFFDLDHWNQEKIRVFDFWPQNDHRRWYPIPRDGAFAFRNEASGEYLSAGDGHVVHTSPDIMGGGATCAWRLVDPETMQHSRVLWDPIATMLPEVLSPLVPTSSVDSMTREGKFLRTKPASPRSHAELLASLEDGQHSLVRDMLTSGDTLVVMPGLTLAWRRGRVHKVLTSEDENIFRTQRWRGRRDDFSNQCLEE